jgi:hypothetical protein
MNVTITHTRFRDLAIRSYIDITRVNVPGHPKPFRDTYHRFLDLPSDQDIGPSFHTRAEAFACLHTFAAERGYKTKD